MKGYTVLPMTSTGLFEVRIYGLAALDTHRPVETIFATEGPRPRMAPFDAEHEGAEKD